jgi:hypothetical protein
MGVALALAPRQSDPVAAGAPPPSAAGEHILDPANRSLQGNQVAIDVMAGSMHGRALGQTFIAGARLTYYPIRQLGIGAAYGYSLGIGGLDTVHRTNVHFVHGQLELPLVSALRMGKHKIVAMDLFGEAGAGALHIAQRWQAMGVIGGGVRIYPGVRWLAVRIDAITYLHDTRRETGKAFDTDVAFTLGLSFLLPPRGPRWPRARR